MTGGTLYNTANAERTFTGVAIDSRTVRPGELFVAIKGVRVDGHEFISQAIERGASGIISEFSFSNLGQIRGDVAVIAVENSHAAMISLATKYRQTSSARFIGITGSNGKTTTKEFLYQMLRAFEPATYRSPGNLNNLFGAPLSLFSMPHETRIAIMELGISIKGEMARLAQIIRPDVAVITNVGATHLEHLGSAEGVAREKLQLILRPDTKAQVIINGDDPILVSETQKIRSDFVTFGVGEASTFRPDAIVPDGPKGTTVTIEGHRFRLPLFGRHQVYNLLAAYVVCRTLGYDFAGIDTEALAFDSAPMRGQSLVRGGITFVADCYNANPESVRSGLASLSKIAIIGRRVIVLGDMLELGAGEKEYHREIGRLLADQKADKIVLVGTLSRHTLEAALSASLVRDTVEHFATAEAAAEFLKGYLHKDDFVYVKGSRGIRLEAILDKWEAKESAG